MSLGTFGKISEGTPEDIPAGTSENFPLKTRFQRETPFSKAFEKFLELFSEELL